jgi:hypothetical protein
MEEVAQHTERVMEVAGTHGYDVKKIGVYLQPIEQGRACHLEFQFYYDPEDEEDKGRVRALYMEAARNVYNRGAFFSRPDGLLSPMVFEHARGYTNTIRKVKGVLDPKHIMCPGNLCF